MMNFGWQDALVALVLLGALGWLVRRNLRAQRSGKVCASCPSAESGECAQGAAPAPVMIPLAGISLSTSAARPSRPRETR
jgi:hypothetical protein